jgi:hypothetical protein
MYTVRFHVSIRQISYSFLTMICQPFASPLKWDYSDSEALTSALVSFPFVYASSFQRIVSFGI